MDPQKFWDMVEKDPWLPWVIYVGRQLRIGDLLEDPSLLGEMLSPRMIKGEIAYIAFRPWEKLDLEFKCKEVTTKKSEGGTSEVTETALDATIYWHKASSDEFSQVLPLEKDQTVREALAKLSRLSEAVTIDAIVLTGHMDRWKVKDSADPDSRLIAALIDPASAIGQSCESYDIFRPDLSPSIEER